LCNKLDIFDPLINTGTNKNQLLKKIKENCEFIHKLNEIVDELNERYHEDFKYIYNNTIKSEKIDQIFYHFMLVSEYDHKILKEINKEIKLYQTDKEKFKKENINTSSKEIKKRLINELIKIQNHQKYDIEDPKIKEMIRLKNLKNQIRDEQRQIVLKYKDSISENLKNEIIILNFKEVLKIIKEDKNFKSICLLSNFNLNSKFQNHIDQKKNCLMVLTYKI